MKNKKKIINSISIRIKDEYRKHKNLDWAKIAAIKIYSEHFEFPIISEVKRILYKHSSLKNK